MSGRWFHSSSVSSWESERYSSSTSRIRATNDSPMHIIDTSKSRLNERMSMLLEPMTAVSSSIDRCLECSTAGYGYW